MLCFVPEAHQHFSAGVCFHPCRAIEKGQAQLCILAEDCNQPDYKKLIEALCAEHNVNLIAVPENKQLGQWCGVSTLPSLPLLLAGTRQMNTHDMCIAACRLCKKRNAWKT